MKSVVSYKERYSVWLFIWAYVSLYTIINHIVEANAPYETVAMEWEKGIPFLPVFILPYQFLTLNLVILFFLIKKRIELWVFALRVLFVFSISYIFFIFMPLEYSFMRPKIDSNWFIVWLFSLVDAVDLPYNQLPSLHVSSCVVYWYSLREYISNIWVKRVLFVWYVLIGVSTLFVYQHHFLDIPTGLLLGICAVWLISKSRVANINILKLRSVK